MPWYFNFCAPHLPNDPTINFHRYIQTGCLLGCMVLYMIIHLFYKLFGPDPKQQEQTKKQAETQSQNEKASDENTQNNHDDDKSISIAGGFQGEENSSIGPFNKKRQTKKSESKKEVDSQVLDKVTIQQIQNYFPIVFGHFSIGSAFTIMYSPYAEQTIATMLYIVLALILVLVNSRRKIKTTRFIWGMMCMIICFLVMSGLLEVGQANYNKMQNECFSVGYQALY